MIPEGNPKEPWRARSQRSTRTSHQAWPRARALHTGTPPPSPTPNCQVQARAPWAGPALSSLGWGRGEGEGPVPPMPEATLKLSPPPSGKKCTEFPPPCRGATLQRKGGDLGGGPGGPQATQCPALPCPVLLSPPLPSSPPALIRPALIRPAPPLARALLPRCLGHSGWTRGATETIAERGFDPRTFGL